MNNATCFSKDELRLYLLGGMSEESSDAVAVHVESCSECESTVAKLDLESDTLVSALRLPVADDELESAYQMAAKRVKSQWRRSRRSPGSHESLSNLPPLRDYELLEPLARGGMGNVYLARHTRLNRRVALKVLPGRWLQDPAVVARFEREMQAVGSLHHPAIVQATDGGEAEGVHFLVMEFIDGLDARAVVQYLGPLPIADACEIARQAAVGMAYVHDQGTIHRDLKPSNLMVTQAGEVKVLDLGLARVVSAQLTGDELTTVGQLMGTLDFMAPEQLENSHEVDQQADIYSLGATLYKLLTARSPHAVDDQEPFLERLRRIAADPPTPLKHSCDHAPDELCVLVDRMLSRQAADRPASMADVARSLEAFTVNSDLARRTKEARRICDQRKNDKAQHGLGHSALRDASPQGESQGPSARTPSSLRWAVAGLLLLAAAMGVVITLQTIGGQVVIETAHPDTEIRLLKAGKPHRHFTLSQKVNSWRLGTGEYDIEIVGDADSLEVVNGNYTLKQGDVWVAKIVHRDTEQIVAGPIDPLTGNPAGVPRRNDAARHESEKPTYEGKTHAQWLTLLRTERSVKQLYEACQALRMLDTDDDTETVNSLLIAARYHDSRVYYTDGKNSVQIWNAVQDVLKVQDQGVVVDEMIDELAAGRETMVSFVLDYVADHAEKVRPQADRRLIEHISRIARSDGPKHRVESLFAMKVIAPREKTIELLESALRDHRADVQLVAAGLLIEMDSSTQAVVAALRQTVLSKNLANRAEAAWHLGDLGNQAKSAIPELVQCVEEDDTSVARAGVHYAAHQSVSVKDAAVRALAEIGDASVVPQLIAEWERRVYDAPRTRTEPKWRSDVRFVTANTYNADWVGDAIEQLIGRRPDAQRVRDGSSVTTWLIKKRSLERIYRSAFDGTRVTLPEDLYQSAKTLLPLSQSFERVNASRYIENVERAPNPEELALRLKLIELLAESENPKAILRLVFVRRSEILSSKRNSWTAEEKMAALAAYRSLATRIIRSQENWKSEYVAYLLAAIDDRYPGAAVALLDLMDEIEKKDQIEGAVKVFQLIQGLGASVLGSASETLDSWMADSANRAAIQKHIEEDTSRSWSDLTMGMYRSGMADDAVTEELKKRFTDDSIKRVEVFASLIQAMNSGADVSTLIVELIEHPALDEMVIFDSEGERIESSLREVKFLKLLLHTYEDHRSRFRPMLEKLVETGTEREVQAAREILEEWK